MFSFKKHLAESQGETSYGYNWDFSNESWSQVGGILFTFFQLGNMYYMVSIDTASGEISFGTSDVKSVDPTFYDDNIHPNTNPVAVFDSVLYVSLRGASEYGLQKIKFHGANPRLNHLYRKMVQNKIILQRFQDYGWQYQGSEGEAQIFSR